MSLPGGVQGQIMALAREYHERGYEARILAPCDGPPPTAFITPLGRSIPNAANGSVAPIAPDFPAQVRTIHTLWNERFDVIHVHEPFVPGPTITTLLVKPAPLVGTFHAAGDQPAYEALAPLARWFGKRLDARIAVSDDALALIDGALGGGVEVWFNGIERERFANAQPWPSTGRSIFFLGRHEERKGLSVLLQAMSELPADVEIWVGGTGPQTEELQQRFPSNKVQWLGRISDEERERRMAAATVFVAPSLGGESFGVILLEAMAARTAVVASDIPGYHKVAELGDGRLAAELTKVGDASSLAAGINRLLDDDAARKELIANGEDRARGFDMGRLAEQYLDLYEYLTTQDQSK